MNIYHIFREYYDGDSWISELKATFLDKQEAIICKDEFSQIYGSDEIDFHEDEIIDNWGKKIKTYCFRVKIVSKGLEIILEDIVLERIFHGLTIDLKTNIPKEIRIHAENIEAAKEKAKNLINEYLCEEVV